MNWLNSSTPSRDLNKFIFTALFTKTPGRTKPGSVDKPMPAMFFEGRQEIIHHKKPEALDIVKKSPHLPDNDSRSFEVQTPLDKNLYHTEIQIREK